MSATEIVILVLVLLVVAAVVAALMAQARKRKHLQSRFGPEYDRTVEERGRRREAERELAEREQRRRSLDIRPLPETDRVAYAERWRSTQADFVDHPEQAVRQADALVAEVMGRRGYPVGDFEQMSRDVSVDHADTVSEYRAAHEISELNDRHQASTEQLRQAMVHYRALFNDLLSAGGSHESPQSDEDRLHGDRVSDGRTVDDRLHDDRLREDGVQDDRTQDDRVHDEHDARPVASDTGYATDEDRRFDAVDTSRADGVRVEPGGLDRGRGGTEFEHDLPRDDRPRA